MSFLYRIDCLHIKAEYTNVAVFVEKMRENRYDIINDVIKKNWLSKNKTASRSWGQAKGKGQTLWRLSSNFCCLSTKGVRPGIHVGYLNFKFIPLPVLFV